jgi:hypothetical protein
MYKKILIPVDLESPEMVDAAVGVAQALAKR